ncbi:neuraminidase-like domain-containing protein [Aeromonas sp. sif2416]|uniref:Tc toxin subunit A-related protein n=1 Tax=Aeromonas sp. sif2416 TaxID=2854793 RepID=UPI001C43BD13|nr:neuraminidase-like domain-containing protein [Aeromonas sp. sif2416]MBV7437085.1 hypothetical protein [Aeromonas sp. sif2416]
MLATLLMLKLFEMKHMNSQQALPGIFNRVNQLGITSLFELAGQSFTEIRRRVNSVLSYKETRLLHSAVQQQALENHLYEARLLTRRNPLLQNAVRLGISTPKAALRDYDSMFGGRSSDFVAPGSVASMFSPAAYLTELYREASALRPPSSIYHLEQRRPDLQALTLNQQNLEQSLSVLDLSNELLMDGAKTDLATDELGVLTHLSTWRHSGMTPYHAAFERVRQAVLAKDGVNWPVETAPDVMSLMSSASLLGMNSGFSPELYAILTEAITPENAVELYSLNFGAMTTQSLMNMQALSDYYAVDYESLQYFIDAFATSYNDQDYQNDILTYAAVENDGDINIQQITRTYLDSPETFTYVKLLPISGSSYDLLYNFSQVPADTVQLDIKLNGQVIFSDASAAPLAEEEYRIRIAMSESDVANVEFIFSDPQVILVEASANFVFSDVSPEYFLLQMNKWVRLYQATTLAPIELERAVSSPQSNPASYPIDSVTSYSDSSISTSGIALPDGGWVTFWLFQNGGARNLYQRYYSAQGEPLSSDVLISENNVDTPPFTPFGAALASGGWVVCWTDITGGALKAFQQRYDAAGLPVGVSVQVTPNVHWVENISISGLIDGGWVVAWEVAENIYQQRFDLNGVAIGGPQRVSESAPQEQYLGSMGQSITSLVDGGWIVTWGDHNQEFVRFQRYDMAGNAMGENIAVNNILVSAFPSISTLNDGGWVIVWADGNDIYQRRYDHAGAPVGVEIVVNTTPAVVDDGHSVSALIDGGWVVAWKYMSGILQQYFDADGVPVGGESQVTHSKVELNEGSPTIVYLFGLADGGWIATYCGNPVDSTQQLVNVYQQRFHGITSIDQGGSNIDALALRRVAEMQLYIERYGITPEKALTLCNAPISERTFGHEQSQFDRLFNAPPLNGFEFTADGTSIDLNPGNASDNPRKAVLARAFRADDVSLYRLLKIVDYSDSDGLIPNDIEHLSDLYLASLLADVHGLSIEGLAWMLKALGEDGTQLRGIQDADLRRLTLRLHGAVRSLTTLKWDAYQLFVMTTTEYATTLTPEIQNLIDTLIGSLHDTTLTDAALIDAMAPHVAALLRLSSLPAAVSLLTWTDQLQPAGLSVDAFWTAIKAGGTPPPEAVQFSHALAQLALVLQSTGLDDSSLRVLATEPAKLVTLPTGITVAPHDASTLLQLGAYMTWAHQLGGDAATALSALNAGTLTPAMVAQAMGLDPHSLAQAAEQAFAHEQITSAGLLLSWPEIESVLQWVHLSDGLGVAPQALSDFLALDYLNTAPPALAYGDWDMVATNLTAGVALQKASTFEGGMDEALSAALTAYYLREIANPTLGLTSRDDLYRYLLLDNQVGSAVMTTRIAEAIASVQLYINRALDGAETDVDSTVLSRQFFTDWSRYNKRYSTWAGVSQLVYYPENYIDPTVRTGQTVIMDALLQSINQSQLTDEATEGAFDNYLANFEQVADLKVLSGYHDHTDNLQGLTYLVGHRRGNAQDYYWRSLNHNLAQSGTFPANAWSDWRRIDGGVNPHQQVIRPVVRNGRLSLVWLERIEQAEDSSGSVVRSYAHVLKLVQQHYDGSWSTPQSYPADGYLADIGLIDEEVPGLYCAEDPTKQAIVVMLYKRQTDPLTAPVAGFSVGVDLAEIELDADEALRYLGSAYFQMDTDTLRRINNRFVDYADGYAFTLPESIDMSTSSGYGAAILNGRSLSTLSNGYIGNISWSGSDVQRDITIAPVVRMKYALSPVENPSTRDRYSAEQFETLMTTPTTGFDYHFPEYESSEADLSVMSGLVRWSSVDAAHISLRQQSVSSPSNPTEFWTFVEGANGKLDDYVFMADPGYSAHYNFILVDTGLPLLSHYCECPAFEVRNIYRFGSNDARTDLAITPATVRITFKTNGDPQEQYGTGYVSSPPAQSWGGMEFVFNPITFDGTLINFDAENKGSIEVVFEAFFIEGALAGSETFHIPAYRFPAATQPGQALALLDTTDHAQYLQWGPYRTRLNTTFAHQLVALAAKGLDSILALSTQSLPEPQLGHGGYVSVTLPPYDSTLHGSERGVRLELFDASAPGEEKYFAFADVTLNEAPQTLSLFVPVSQEAQGDPGNFPVAVNSGLNFYMVCANGRIKTGYLVLDTATLQLLSFTKEPTWNGARDPDVVVMPTYVEPMDFTGANALYFWELFYYTPMLIAQRLLLEQQFDEAQRWLEFVWKPSGYLVDGVLQKDYWNVRPLLEDTSWNSVPLDSTDPDAVAQQDPMHYKLCTYMRTLDLLLARGDQAYRQLERDSLNEAKMWYAQALHLLGDQPYVPMGGLWSEPSLGEAADDTVQQALHQGLAALRQGAAPEQHTANSLTSLFLPQANEALLTYWQTFEQRLFNLRHNLSIDGQPLALPVYAMPADPAALHNAAVASALGTPALPAAYLPLWRFPQMLENAKAMVSQLSQFGATLLSVRERQDAEALNALLQGQAKELMLLSIDMQNRTIAELDAEHASLTQARRGAQQRLDSFTRLYEENVNSGETAAMALYMASSVVTTAATGLHMGAAALEMVPNIYGLAVGGARYGALLNAAAIGSQLASSAMQTSAGKIAQSEIYRRRRQEWEIQRNNADADVAQFDAQLQGNALRREASVMQKHYLESQQQHIQAQLAFLQSKFSNQALYSWMNGRLSALYFQLYDLTVVRCLLAEQSLRHVTADASISFVKPGAWQSSYAGLLTGETLLLNLAQMEDAYLKWDERALEVTRTVSLSDFYENMSLDPFVLDEEIDKLLTTPGSAGTDTSGISVVSDTSLPNGRLSVRITLSELGIRNDYPSDMQLGEVRRIKQLSVSLPALIGPYQDIQATLTYGGSTSMPLGCNTLAVSHGLNDSGQFQLDFNDGKFLPFEGIAIDDPGLLTLTFPNATAKQEPMLRSLSDIILHIRYTIRS